MYTARKDERTVKYRLYINEYKFTFLEFYEEQNGEFPYKLDIYFFVGNSKFLKTQDSSKDQSKEGRQLLIFTMQLITSRLALVTCNS